jgi:transcriptional regulator with XRE-family HTH domain
MPTLGRFIQRRRIELGLTQEQLAEMIGGGVRQSEISRLEHDRISLPRRQRLEQIAIVLDVSLGELLARSGWAGAEAVFDTDPASHNGLTDEQATNHISPETEALTAAIIRAEQLIADSDDIIEKSHAAYGDAQRAVQHTSARHNGSVEVASQ